MHDFRRKQSLLLQQIFRILNELPLDKAQFHFRCEQSTNSDVTIFPVAVFSTHFRPFLINEICFEHYKERISSPMCLNGIQQRQTSGFKN